MKQHTEHSPEKLPHQKHIIEIREMYDGDIYVAIDGKTLDEVADRCLPVAFHP
jgi:uncharacterized protein (UPF0371 family)